MCIRDSSAVDLLCKATELNPDSDNAYYHLGFAMCKLEQFAAGLECFDKVLALNPGHVQALCDRASALIELGQLVGQWLAMTMPSACVLIMRRPIATVAMRCSLCGAQMSGEPGLLDTLNFRHQSPRCDDESGSSA